MSETQHRDGPPPIAVPVTAALVLAACSLTPRVQANAALEASFWGAMAVALAGAAWVFVQSRRGHAALSTNVLLRPQHWVQALCQLAVLLYWGWYWRPVYDMAVLFMGQLAFAYAVSALISWARGRPWTLGFGPVPIIFSINLFLWFRDDWFYLQFLMIAVGFLGKEWIRWQRGGRSVHIFNPSAFALGLFSLALIATGTTDLTWGREIASTLTLAPHIYTYLFAVGLVVMYAFSITLVAGTAAAVLFGASAVAFAFTGVPYFVDSEIPAAVFLGLHLLVTDPSTSPRTPAGKVVFGALYGVGVFTLYTVLSASGAPTFYDKLLCVPLLNLSVRAIDALVGSVETTLPGLARALGQGVDQVVARRANLAHMAVWIGFFALMSATGRTDGTHPGDRLPFWEEACSEERPGACDRLLQIEASYCGDNSAWACNELGLHYRAGRIVEADPELSADFLGKACELRFQPGCLNLTDTRASMTAEPKMLDLRLLLREGGLNLLDTPEAELYARACRHGWDFACRRVAG